MGSVIWTWTVPQAPGGKPTGVQRIDEASQRYRFCLDHDGVPRVVADEGRL